VTSLPITVFLGLDQGARSGWAIGLVVEGKAQRVVHHGVARNHAERAMVVWKALELAGNLDAWGRHAPEPRHLLVTFESHSGMPLSRLGRHDGTTRRQGRPGAPERSTASILGQGAAKGRWEELLDEVGHPERLRLEVEPRTWRARVLGPAKGAKTADLKHLACTWATALLGEPIVDADEAEGICICAFAMRDGVALLEAGKLKQRLYARGKRDERRQLELGDVREVAR
jgi:hypothetical protein